MTTDIDWGTVLLDTVKELAAQPGGEPWTAVANGVVKLLEENATLKAEIERLQEIVKGQHELFTNAVKEQTADIEKHKEALRRVVGALEVSNAELSLYHNMEERRHNCPCQPSRGMILAEEALAFARRVMEK